MAGPEVEAALKLRDDMSGPLKNATDKATGNLGALGGAALGVIGAAAAAGAGLLAFGIAAVKHTEDAGQAAYEMAQKFGLAKGEASSWLSVGAQLGISSDTIG